MDYTEDQLVEGCIKRDDTFRKLLYQKYSKNIYAQILRYAGNKEDAEDILQETFVTVFSKIGQFQKKSSLWSWIHKIAINQTLIYYRKKNRFLPKGSTETNLNIEERIDDQSIVWNDDYGYQKLLELIRLLPDHYRMSFNLCVIEGLSIKEASEMLHCSRRICSMWLSRAKKQLREKINELNRIEEL